MNQSSLPRTGAITLGGIPDGYEACALADLADKRARAGLVHIARDAERMEAVRLGLRFFAPELEVHGFPGWDCTPYDRVSPGPAVVSARMETLSLFAAGPGEGRRVLLTTVNAAAQRIPPRAAVSGASFVARPGDALDFDALQARLARYGYLRVATVREAGEAAVRGGILDVFPPGVDEPLRLDMFGDRLESLRTFDPLSQRTTGDASALILNPASEIQFDPAAVDRFRAGYKARFGAVGAADPLYASVAAGRPHPGVEHWLPLFHESLDTVFDLLPDAVVSMDYGAEAVRAERRTLVADHYRARRDAGAGPHESSYRPLPPEALYLTDDEWGEALGRRSVVGLSPYRGESDAGARPGRNFAAERTRAGPGETGGIVLDAVRDHIRAVQRGGGRVVVAAISHGSRERLRGLLLDHGIERMAPAATAAEAAGLPLGAVAMAVLPLEHGFETERLALLSEQDLLGERVARSLGRSRRAENFIRELSSLSVDDFVVHVDHGIGRFAGLETLSVQGDPHDCLALVYDGGARLYLPVENLEVISRYGGDAAEVQVDRLGGSAWQARKARARDRIREIAGDLLRVAADRALRQSPRLTVSPGLYAEFCARFPYSETEDQQRTISDVLADLASGRPMDRLVCGDVGFGKTEVALRSAFVAASAGKQVALVAPTTLLVRQHLRTFQERFAGWPVRIAGLSRLAKPGEQAALRREAEQGTLDIAIGTHALLGRTVRFRDLGLLIVDEEQRFGVAHKERLKEARANVHVLTLTATPIPRTLQMALAGVRELSLIATPPVDRLAVRTFILPRDTVVIGEAIQRELGRAGQVFYVCPRIADLEEAAEFVRARVPAARVSVAHGRLPPAELEATMTEFYEGRTDVLVATNIVESGLDIPTANTLVVHRADMFGLAELYQLRGRIGRSKARAYAYLTVPERRIPTAGAEKRLRVMQSLDDLGAGFSLASHDFDIRGGGNLLGAEQSGHIREVGFELYQQMLEEAIAAARAGEEGAEPEPEEAWSPQINVGAAVLIPPAYVSDIDVRLGLYRRVAHLRDGAELEGFAAELIDRFGALPPEAENLLQVVAIKQALRDAGVERLDAGHKGATLVFRNGTFADPAGLARWLATLAGRARFRPDHSLVVFEDWARESERLGGLRRIAEQLAGIARGAGADGGARERARA